MKKQVKKKERIGRKKRQKGVEGKWEAIGEGERRQKEGLPFIDILFEGSEKGKGEKKENRAKEG